MQDQPVRTYFRNIWQTVYTILVGMRVSLKYCFGKTVTVQYPDVPPVVTPRYRGLHHYEIEKCIVCDACARACPVDCIYIEKSGPRKIDKESGTAVGGAVIRYAIDYAKCMFCGLCTEPCPTHCLHMGNIHDMSAYDRQSMMVEFTDLAREGLQTPRPLWMQKSEVPAWARRRQKEWVEFAHSDDQLTGQNELRREKMRLALEPSEIPKKKAEA
ncbi:MAG: NADH-quinone oxidoreductase subunit I [Planctomycetes bacterium]|nr:NADH-quinone oxidoreductase subunit I [Planctomycetota bacterium]